MKKILFKSYKGKKLFRFGIGLIAINLDFLEERQVSLHKYVERFYVESFSVVFDIV